MKKKVLSCLCAGLLFFAFCAPQNPSYPYHVVPHSFIYSIVGHNDSLYFSTLENGLFRFHPDNPGAVVRIGGFRRFPFRSMLFLADGHLLAASYYGGVFCAGRDTLTPLKTAPYAAWSMRLDDSGSLWLATTRGVLRQAGDGMIVFKNLADAHDVAFVGNSVAVAHMRGITFYNRETRTVVAEYCRGVICWTLARFDSVLAGGGSGICILIGPSGCRAVRVPPQGNMPWSITRDTSGAIVMATQKGLFCAGPRDSVAHCIGFEGRCVKSVTVDRSGRLWVGTFYR